VGDADPERRLQACDSDSTSVGLTARLKTEREDDRNDGDGI